MICSNFDVSFYTVRLVGFLLFVYFVHFHGVASTLNWINLRSAESASAFFIAVKNVNSKIGVVTKFFVRFPTRARLASDHLWWSYERTQNIKFD